MDKSDHLAAGRGDGSRLERRQPFHHLLYLREYLVHRPRPADDGAAVPGGPMYDSAEVRNITGDEIARIVLTISGLGWAGLGLITFQASTPPHYQFLVFTKLIISFTMFLTNFCRCKVCDCSDVERLVPRIS